MQLEDVRQEFLSTLFIRAQYTGFMSEENNLTMKLSGLNFRGVEPPTRLTELKGTADSQNLCKSSQEVCSFVPKLLIQTQWLRMWIEG